METQNERRFNCIRGLDWTTNHQNVAKDETIPRAMRPPLWRDKLRIEGESVDANEKNTDGNRGPDECFDRGESFVVACSPCTKRARGQEGVMNFCIPFPPLSGTFSCSIESLNCDLMWDHFKTRHSNEASHTHLKKSSIFWICWRSSERCESFGPRWLHDPQFDDHSEQQDRECTNLDHPCHQQDCVVSFWVILAYMCVKLQMRLYVCHRVGPLWVHCGSIVGPLWVHCGSIVGPLWVHSGSILGPFWVHFGSIWGPFWVHFGSILGPFWVHFGSILGPFWVHFGSILGPFWVHSGSILGPFWVHSGSILGPFC